MDEYMFPDEPGSDLKEDDIEIVYVDDTPEDDRGRQPMPKEIVEKLESDNGDELESYSKETKEKFNQLKKVWHDERRAKEEAFREQQEALRLAQSLFEENQRLNKVIGFGEKDYTEYVHSTAQQEYNAAKTNFKRAYETGDTDGVVEAQEAMAFARNKIQQARNFNYGALQTPQNAVNVVQERLQRPTPPPVNITEKDADWQAKNTWFGKDPEMTAAALGLHQALVEQGAVPGSDEYYQAVDATMRKRFSDKLGQSKRYNNVAPANRSTGKIEVSLNKSQRAIAKKFGLTDKQYAKELQKINMAGG